jgi:hypothetical protein
MAAPAAAIRTTTSSRSGAQLVDDQLHGVGDDGGMRSNGSPYRSCIRHDASPPDRLRIMAVASSVACAAAPIAAPVAADCAYRLG